MTILNPCPFCGGEAILESNKLRYGTIYSAYCQKCGAEITGFSEHEAVAAWNRRSDAVPVVRGEWVVDECDTTDDAPNFSWIDFHCSECNTDYGLEEGQYGWCRYEKIPYQYCPNCGAKMEDKP